MGSLIRDSGERSNTDESSLAPVGVNKNSKSEVRVSIVHGSKDQEIENIKRLLAHIIQRLDQLKGQ